MTTAVRNQLVRDYLDQLRAAARDLPSASASKLRAQIAAHLDERLHADADEQEIELALAELGSVEQLVAEQLALTGRSRLAWVRRIRWWVWLIVVAVLGAAGTVSGFIISVRTTPDLEGPGTFGWLTAWDSAHSRTTNALSGNQTLTAIHPGHLQGFFVSVTNDTSRAQTVLGPTSLRHSLGSQALPSIGVSEYSPFGDGGSPTEDHFTPSATIPPGQTRLIKVSWVSQRACLLGTQTMEGSDTLGLRVKVGPFTRDENIELGQVIGLYGTKADCPAPNG